MHYCVRCAVYWLSTIALPILHYTIHFELRMTMVKFRLNRLYSTVDFNDSCDTSLSSSNCRALTAFTWILNTPKHIHIRLTATMENQFKSPSILCVAFRFAMLSSIGLLQNHFALIMDEIDYTRGTHELSVTSTRTHKYIHAQTNTRTAYRHNTHTALWLEIWSFK